ncbi:ph-response sensor protein [Coccidioides posadasii str. Silveira]|uniref:pH response protein PalF n=2 Tax=Coccidioides posadasii TaxID=199306 RepID=E9DCM7_COCPS|nr:palFp, putative [Coccidioides posadasii C735 delta SOWgp]EER22971.1 palFp, putative [Coccidioides posadasii C735 delta SOWgp]EFW15951.1 pH response protein PalF [Coccidioides posadasii str. Silveira]QVM09603.1 ph-response sensor protein [Coccidioides posadasii str. Silveira]|eukprot:XP_003065116.1 palFp, putative [Coccidioides posadasii C735 delta SOWgp]
MALDSPNGDATSASPARKRSILSKFTNRFGNRNRNISEFYIQPDDPWRSYSPGDIVNGSVCLVVVKPVRITHLVVCLHGYAKVYKNPVAPGETAEDSGFPGTGRGRRNGEYLGNGLATLFEDEIVLCGDGRLKEGIYKFRFELCFPPYSLPSSINFERGTISYVITSTLTRPTTISPTISCDKRILLLETIDIANLPAPKPRVISLEPISKRSKTRSKTKSTSSEMPRRASSLEPQSSDSGPPLSPVPSERSNSSCVSNSTQSFQIVSEPSSARCGAQRNDDLWSGATSSASREITATTKVLRAGVLPGDLLPVNISIKHTKPIRSPNGVIITLYRQGRIDMYPQLPIGTPEKGKKPVYEDYYPKSRTGLGGLSFGVTRTSSVFRKDLSQIFCALIVDPNTMTAEIKTSIRIPENAFPTITRVPGAMISFRYYVEVVMDIRGKLAGQDRFLPRLNMMSNNFYGNGKMNTAAEIQRGMTTSNVAGNILDTEQVRRDKSVIVCLFEIVVGSKDSSRGQRQDASSLSDQSHQQSTSPDDLQEQQSTPRHTRSASQSPPPHNGYDPAGTSHWPDHPPPHSDYSPDFPPPMFIPPAQPEENVDEKTRLRRAEEMLLPSEPPPHEGDVAGPSSAPHGLPPSAPVLSEDDSNYQPANTRHNHNDFNPVNRNTSPSVSAPSTDTITPTYCITNDHSPPSIPSGHPQAHAWPEAARNNASLNNTVPQSRVQDDKQELERQRLLNEASSPGDYGYAPIHEGDFSNNFEPSAPALTEEDIFGHPVSGTQAEVEGESLPKYQRGSWNS